MTENVIIAPEYKERAERVISEHMDLAWIANEGVRIAYLASDKEKKSHRRPIARNKLCQAGRRARHSFWY